MLLIVKVRSSKRVPWQYTSEKGGGEESFTIAFYKARIPGGMPERGTIVRE